MFLVEHKRGYLHLTDEDRTIITSFNIKKDYDEFLGMYKMIKNSNNKKSVFRFITTSTYYTFTCRTNDNEIVIVDQINHKDYTIDKDNLMLELYNYFNYYNYEDHLKSVCIIS